MMTIKKRMLPLLVSLLVVFTVFSGCIDNKKEPKLIKVATDGTGDYTSIQDAITAASTGDTIQIHNGTYSETLLINKTIHVIGASTTNTILTPNKSDVETLELDIITITADNCTISGLSIIGIHGYTTTRGIYLTSSNTIIADNHIINATEAIAIASARNTTLSMNTITNNEHGVVLTNTFNTIITRNNISSNTQYGIYLSSNSDNNVITDNVIMNNTYGIRIKGSQYNEVYRNKITHTAIYGIYLCCMARNNMLYNNSLIKNTKHADDKYDNQWFHNGIGNYWDDYKEKQPNATDENNDGIWDTPYLIYEETENKDEYPLVYPVTIPIKKLTC